MHVSDFTNGFTSAYQQVVDGDGTSCPLYVSISSVKLTSALELTEMSAPASPSAGQGYVYPKSDGKIYYKNAAGTEYDLTASTGAWGSISGTLSNQTDLQNALDLKANISSLATVATSGDYNDLLNLPSIPTQYTDEMSRDAIALFIQNGTGISWSHNDGANTLTPTVSLASFTTDNLAEGSNLYYTTARFNTAFSNMSTSDLVEGTNLYYTDERVDDRVSALIQNGTGITWSYNDGAGTLTPTVTITQYTDEMVDDRVAALCVAGSNMTITYDDGTNTLTFESTGGGTPGGSDTQVQFNDGGSFGGDSGMTFNKTTNALTITGAFSASNVSGTNTGDQTSIVGITGSKAQFDTACSDGNFLYVGDITQYTDEMAQDTVATMIQNGTGITWSYNDGANTLTPTVTITQYTDELAQDAIGSILLDSTTIDFTYDDATPNITASVKANSITSTHIDGTDAVNIKTELSLNNVENTALSTWAGSTNITTLGTIATGTWQGTIIAPAYLGTGTSITTKYLRGDGTWQTISAGGLANVVEDTTPQLGGDLDLNGNQITSPDGTDQIDIPNGTIDLITNSNSRIDITDSGVRLGGANARVTTILDEDTMSSNSATALCTQQSIKAYVDANASGGGGLTIGKAYAISIGGFSS